VKLSFVTKFLSFLFLKEVFANYFIIHGGRESVQSYSSDWCISWRETADRV